MSNAFRLIVVMDPIEEIKYEKDTSLAILLAAKQRGWPLYYAEMADLRLRDGVAEARLRQLDVQADPDDWYRFGEQSVGALGKGDVVLMRKDPPFDTEYI